MNQPAVIKESIESEKLILAAALDMNRSPLLDTMLALVAGSDFSVEHHGMLWNIVRMLHETRQAHDVTAVADYTRQKKLFVGGVEFLFTLAEDPLAMAATDDSVLQAAGRVKHFAAIRSLEALLAEAQRKCGVEGENLDTVLSFVDDGIQSLRKATQTSRTGPVNLTQVMEQVMVTLERQADGQITPGVPTGFDELDALITGLADEDLVVIGARPSMGKTTLALNIAENIAARHSGVFVFSMEMKAVTLGQRYLARNARVNLTNIIKADLADEDWSRIVEGIENTRDSTMWIDDSPGLTIADIRARARAHVAKFGKCVFFVDYLQYVSQSAGNRDVKDHVSEVSRGLKDLARELRCPVVALSQLSRSLEQRANKRPMMSDLRESGAIEQDADVIMFIYRDEVYNPETKEPGIGEVIVAKHRNGPTGVAKLGYANGISSFFNMNNDF